MTWVTATPLLAIAVVTVAGPRLVGAWLASQPGGLGGAGSATRSRGEHARRLPARGPELRRRPRRDAGLGLESQLYSGWAALGLASAGENPQDVARGRPQPDRLHRERRGLGVRPGRRRAQHPGRRRRRAAGDELRRARPRRRASRRHPPQRLGQQPDELDVVRGARVPGGGRRAAAGSAGVARPPAGRRRRLQLRDPRRAERRRRHRGGARGAGRRRRLRGRAGAVTRGRLHPGPAGPRRRLPEHAGRRARTPSRRRWASRG